MEKEYFEIYDENTGKSLMILATSLEEAEVISSNLDFNNFEEGEEVII